MSTPAARSASGRRKSVAGVAFAPSPIDTKAENANFVSGIAVSKADKENFGSPQVRPSKYVLLPLFSESLVLYLQITPAFTDLFMPFEGRERLA